MRKLIATLFCSIVLLPVQTIGSPVASPMCETLSLFTLRSSTRGADSRAEDSLNKLFERFEESFRKNDVKLFRSLIHPAMTREAKNVDIFNSTVEDFGLKQVELRRSFAYLLKFGESSERQIQCQNGRVRGVVGPREQVAMVHQFLGGNEQIRIFTLVAPVPSSIRKDKDLEWGIVMLHAQVWTHGRQSPIALRDEAQKWFLLGEPLTAWLLSTAGKRILEANPYFEPAETPELVQQASRYEGNRPDSKELTDLLQKNGVNWKFEDTTVVFQARSLEIGLKVRMDAEDLSVNKQIETCKKVGRVFAQTFPGIRHRFSGFECLTYLPNEPINLPSDSGSQFHQWDERSAQK